LTAARLISVSQNGQKTKKKDLSSSPEQSRKKRTENKRFGDIFRSYMSRVIEKSLIYYSSF
jgi:hypothetical protein